MIRFDADELAERIPVVRDRICKSKPHNLPHLNRLINRLISTPLVARDVEIPLFVEDKANVDKCKACGLPVKKQQVVRSLQCAGCRYHVVCAAVLIVANGRADFDECYGALMTPSCRMWKTRRPRMTS